MATADTVPMNVSESASRCLNDAAKAISSLAALAASVGSGGSGAKEKAYEKAE